MDLTKLKHAAMLTRHRSYTRAAEALGLTQSALTRSIKTLEDELGLRLFDRGRGGVTPTSAGKRLAAEAEDVLRRFRTVEQNMSLLASNRIGDVAFGMGPLPASVILPNLLARAARIHAGVRIRTVVGSAADLLKSLHADDVEFVVVSRGVLDAGAQLATIETLGWVELAALVRKGHPLAGRRITDKDLAAYPVIGGSPMNAISPAHSAGYRPTITCDNYDALRAVTLQSDAIWISATCLAGRQLVALRGAGIPKRTELVAVSPPGRTLSPIALELLEECKEFLREAAPSDDQLRRRSR